MNTSSMYFQSVGKHMASILLFFGATLMAACTSGQAQTEKPRDYFFHPHNAVAEAPMPVRTGADKKTIQEQKFEVIETGLQPLVHKSVSSFARWPGIWLNDNLLLVNAIQDVANADEKHLQRAMLVDARTGKSTTLIKEGWVICRNEELEVADVEPIVYDRNTGRFVHLDTNGILTELSLKPEVELKSCISEKLKRSKNPLKGTAQYLRESDGFILLTTEMTPAGESDIEKSIWHKPGVKPLELQIYGREISTAIYLPHLQKYLLNTRDSQGNSNTDRRLGGIATWRNRPYDLTPYRLMARDGSIEEIPYPKVIFDYGIRYFGVVLPTKAGLLINAPSSKNSEYGMFLLNGDRLTRFFGGPRSFGLDGREGVDNISLSPDGCKIAFNLYSDWRAVKKQIMIINLCKAHKSKGSASQ